MYDGGTVTITNSTISNNTVTSDPLFTSTDGGGIMATPPAPGGTLTLTNTNVTGNSCVPDAGSGGSGGGIEVVSGPSSYSVAIHGGSISNNTAPAAVASRERGPTPNFTIDSGTVISGNHATVGNGGGIEDNSNITIGTGTVISGNQAASSGGGVSIGGGSSITKATITNNTAGGAGGGVYVSNGPDAQLGSAAAAISFSRIVGNTATTGANEVDQANVGGALVTLTDDWFGTNVPSTSDIAPQTSTPIVSDRTDGSAIVTATTAVPHRLVTGQQVEINGASNGTDNGPVIITVTSPTTFTYKSFASDPSIQPPSTGGQVSPLTPPTLASNIMSATESGSTVTITTNGSYGFAVGNLVDVAGVGVSGYNGTFIIKTATATTFTYTDSQTGLLSSSGGSATILANSVLQLRVVAGAASVEVGSPPTPITADFLTDSANNPISTSNLTTLIGQPITFSVSGVGSVVPIDTTIQSSGMAAATFNGGARDRSRHRFSSGGQLARRDDQHHRLRKRRLGHHQQQRFPGSGRTWQQHYLHHQLH